MENENLLIKKVVKYKKLQKVSHSSAIIMPKSWLIAMGWNQQTKFVMELHPLRKEFIVTEVKDEEVSGTQPGRD
jgi:hypothetical protein